MATLELVAPVDCGACILPSLAVTTAPAMRLTPPPLRRAFYQPTPSQSNANPSSSSNVAIGGHSPPKPGADVEEGAADGEKDGGGFDAVAFTMDDGTVVQVDRECTSIRGNEATTSDFEAFAASVGPRSAAILEARKGGWLDYKVGPLSVTAPPGWKPKPEMEFVKVVEGPWDSLTITLRVAQAASSDWAAAPHLVGSYLMVDGSHLAKTSRSVRRESWGTVEVQCWAAVPAPEPHDEKYPDDVESAASAVMSWDSGGACLVTAYHSIPRTQYESEPEPLETLRRMVETVALAVSRIPRTPGDE